MYLYPFYFTIVLAGLLTGTFNGNTWKGGKEPVDFYLVKGLLEQLAVSLNTQFEFVRAEKTCDEMHPNRTASILWNGKNIGFIGQIHPKYALENALENGGIIKSNDLTVTATNPDATITGTAPNFVLNLTIPQGPTGPTGPTGPIGT